MSRRSHELGGSANSTRLAVTSKQISDLGLETPVKKDTDDRAFGSRTTRTCQAEAIVQGSSEHENVTDNRRHVRPHSSAAA
jgi:hypothetical protein